MSLVYLEKMKVKISKTIKMKKDRLSYSALSAFSKSPNHLLSYWNKEEAPPTDAQEFGKLLHKMVLEPEELLEEYIQYEGRRAGKAWTEFQELHLSKTIVTTKLYNHCYKTYSKALQNKIFKDLLSKTTETEKHIEWWCKGVNFHGYVDMVGEGFIADIKTTTDAGERFERDLYYDNLGYIMQGAMYLEAFPKDTSYYIIAIEKSEPYNVQVYELSEKSIYRGVEKYNDLVDAFKEWDGQPMSYSSEIKLI